MAQGRNENVGGSNKAPKAAAQQTAKQGDGKPSADANKSLADFTKAKNAKDAKEAEAKKAAAKGKDGRPKLPPLPRKAGAPKPLTDCACGCGMKTRSKFAPGHDSRVRGWSLRIARGLLTLETMGKFLIEEGESKESAAGQVAAVEAHIKDLKKKGEWEALKTAKPAVKKATKPSDDEDDEDEDEQDEE